jgi:hypothetical protein
MGESGSQYRMKRPQRNEKLPYVMNRACQLRTGPEWRREKHCFHTLVKRVVRQIGLQEATYVC